MRMTEEQVRIENFIKNYVRQDECVVVFVSGGIDSDVTARLCCKALGKEHVKLCIVLQSELEERFLRQAEGLAKELDVQLCKVHLENMNRILVGALEEAEDSGEFRLDMPLDSAKAKCSLRSAVISCYQDKGYIIAGTTNKTERLLGFLMTFGDNLANFKPLAHLYKTQVRELAQLLGTAQEVIEQDSSSGFWEGETDAEDIAYWIINKGPILRPRRFSEEEIKYAEDMIPFLTVENIDDILKMYEMGENIEKTVKKTLVRKDIVEGIYSIADKAPIYKTRKIMVELED